MKIREYMKKNVVTILVTATVGEAATLFAKKHVGTLPIIDTDHKLVGILHTRDLLKLVMPDFVYLFEDLDFVGDFGDFETLKPTPEQAVQPVTNLMVPPISVEADCGLLRAFALMYKSKSYDLPIVDTEDRLIGLASIVDISSAILRRW